MKKISAFLSITVLVVSIFNTQAIAGDAINTLERSGVWGYKPNGVAIRGYDTVAYFTQGQPVEGKDDHTVEWQGAIWKFSSQEHLALFTNSPETYAPQYGGYCAYGVANNYLVKIEPDSWRIVDDKLYLNYNKSVQKQWEENIPAFINTADTHYPSLLSES